MTNSARLIDQLNGTTDEKKVRVIQAKLIEEYVIGQRIEFVAFDDGDVIIGLENGHDVLCLNAESVKIGLRRKQ